MHKKNLTAFLSWVAICIIWGTTYLAIRVGVEDLPPILFSGLRWLIAGPILLSILKYRGMAFPKKSDLVPIMIIGLALLGLGNGLVVFAEQWIPSGLTALLITTVPFWIVGIESLSPSKTKVNFKIMVGLSLGLVGVGIIFGTDLKTLFDPQYLTGVIGIMVAIIGWSAGTVYSKHKKVNVHPLMSASVQMTVSGAVLSLLGLALGEVDKFNFTAESFAAFTYLIIVGALIAYSAYIYAIAHLPISFVSTYAYVNPIIALFLGWLVLDEKINTTIIVAAVIILIGVAVVKKGTESLKSEN
ncbi:MAG: EamA family transporter [Ignavibacteriales bacterium]|nr:EamA family transporter [Ignavibacteriales bacterium]